MLLAVAGSDYSGKSFYSDGVDIDPAMGILWCFLRVGPWPFCFLKVKAL